MSRQSSESSQGKWEPKWDQPAPKAQEPQQEQEEHTPHEGREAAGMLASLPASSGEESRPFGFYRGASDSSSSSSSSLSRRSEPTNQQEEERQEQEEQRQQQERTTLAMLASPRDAGDKTPFIFHATENEGEDEEEDGEESHGSSSSSMSSLSSSSSVNSLTALPDEEREEDEDEEKEELAALQEAMKESLESDSDRHLAEVQEEREAAANAMKEERRQSKELEEGDTDIYTLLFDLICMLTEDLFHVCLPALLSFCLSLLRLLKRGAWREVGPLVGQKLQRLSSNLTVIPSDVVHYISNFPFLPSMALMGMGLLLGCGVWYWRLQMEYEETAATTAAAVAAAASTTVEEVEERLGLEDALVGLAEYVKGVMSA